MDMTTSIRQVGGVTIVDISGRIVLGEESAALRDLVCDLLSKGHKKILFNLGDVNYIDSSGLGHLVSAFTSVRKQEGELKLLNLTNKVHDLMQITRLYTVFDITDDEALAVKSFGSIGSGNLMTVELAFSQESRRLWRQTESPGQTNPRSCPVQESGGGSERELGAWLYRVQRRR